MALSDTGTAIGGVSRLLKDVLTTALNTASPTPNITVSRPEPGSSGTVPDGSRLNLFLYEVQLDASLRNVPLTPGRPSPLWLVLRYLMTAFDEQGDSDTDTAHDILGMAMQALLGMNESGVLDQLSDTSLTDNPEPLKVTFDDGTPELLSRLMQGPDDRYRTSVPFQIRPVLVANSEPPSSMLLVGVNYNTNAVIGLEGVQNILLPSLGPVLDSVSPPQVQPGDALTIQGSGLGGTNLAVRLGGLAFTATQSSGKLKSTIGGAALDPTRISAGPQPVAVTQVLANGMTLSSNSLSVSLLPILTGVTATGITTVSGGSNVFGTLEITGQFLGTKSNYVEVGLLTTSGVAVLVDRQDPGFTPPADQTAQQILMKSADAVPPGPYTLVVRVNGAQARQAVKLNLV